MNELAGAGLAQRRQGERDRASGPSARAPGQRLNTALIEP
jgi:hypothetical protein